MKKHKSAPEKITYSPFKKSAFFNEKEFMKKHNITEEQRQKMVIRIGEELTKELNGL